jgi:hypothetical protein
MKLKATIKLPSLTSQPRPEPFKLNLNVLKFDPVAVYGESGWKLEEPRNGFLGDSAGFAKTLAKAVAMSLDKMDEALELLLPTGLAQGKTVFTGEVCLVALANRCLAGPELGLSLLMEEGQKTLRFLRATFKVRWIAFDQATIVNPSGRRGAMFLWETSDKDAMWELGFRYHNAERLPAQASLAFAPKS